VFSLQLPVSHWSGARPVVPGADHLLLAKQTRWDRELGGTWQVDANTFKSCIRARLFSPLNPLIFGYLGFQNTYI